MTNPESRILNSESYSCPAVVRDSPAGGVTLEYRGMGRPFTMSSDL